MKVLAAEIKMTGTIRFKKETRTVRGKILFLIFIKNKNAKTTLGTNSAKIKIGSIIRG